MRCAAERACAGFSVIEYAVMVMAVIAGLVTMHNFVVGAIGARWRDAGDTFGGGQLCGPPTCPE